MPSQRAEPGVQLAAHVEQLSRRAGQGLLLPGQRHRPQQSQQGRRRGQDDPLGHRCLQQRRVRLAGRGEEGLAGDEAHDDLGRVRERRPVLLAREGVHVRTHRAGVVVVTLLEERRQRRLGVHDDVLAARQVDHHVRSDRRAGAGRADGLLGEVDPVEHPRVLDHPSQLDLAPGPAGVGGAQGADQGRGLGPQRLVRERQTAELLAQAGVLLDPVALEHGDLPFHPRQRGAERGQGLLLGSAVLQRRLQPQGALPQQVALGGHPGSLGRRPRTQHQGDHRPAGHDADEGADQERAEQQPEVERTGVHAQRMRRPPDRTP